MYIYSVVRPLKCGYIAWKAIFDVDNVLKGGGKVVNLTFERFIATRSWSDNLAKAVDSSQWGDSVACGQVYAGGLCIESALDIEEATGEYVLTIGNCQRFGDLDSLERDLYEFAVSEGYFD